MNIKNNTLKPQFTYLQEDKFVRNTNQEKDTITLIDDDGNEFTIELPDTPNPQIMYECGFGTLGGLCVGLAFLALLIVIIVDGIVGL